MNPPLSEQLKTLKLDISTYAHLPVRDDVLAIIAMTDKEDKTLLKQWEKLNYLRKHLKILEKYIQTNEGEPLLEWLHNNRQGLSDIVLKKIGNYNDDTGGISAYYLNLQSFYDKEEEKYDGMESKASIPEDSKTIIDDLRAKRTESRKIRIKVRKIKTKDMKIDNKGYLYVTIDEPKIQPPESLPTENSPSETIKKNTKNIGIWIAGTIILVGIIYAITSPKK